MDFEKPKEGVVRRLRFKNELQTHQVGDLTLPPSFWTGSDSGPNNLLGRRNSPDLIGELMKYSIVIALLALTACSSKEIKTLPDITPIGSVGSEMVVLEDGKAQLVERQALEARLASSRWWVFNMESEIQSENGVLYHCQKQLALHRKDQEPPAVFKFKKLKREYTEKIGLIRNRLYVETRSDINQEIQLNESFRDSVEELLPSIKEEQRKCNYRLEVAGLE